MATEEDATSKRPAANDPDQVPDMEDIPVAGEMSLEALGLSTRVGDVLSKAGLETAQDILDRLADGEAEFLAIRDIGPKALEEVQQQLTAKGLQNAGHEQPELERENQVRNKIGAELHETEEALAAAQAESKREQREKDKAEKASLKVQEAERVTAVNAELPVAASGENSEEKPVSFVVRVTVDERGNVRRTEVKHAKTGTKVVFPDLDGHKLTTFIMKHIRPPVATEIRAKPSVSEPIAPPPAPATILTIADIKIADNGAGFFLTPDEAFVVENRFRLDGPEAASLAAREVAFEVKVYAKSVASGKTTFLAADDGNLVEGDLEYTAEMDVPGLSPGSYRLDTLVLLQEPANMVEYHEGPIFPVSKRQ